MLNTITYYEDYNQEDIKQRLLVNGDCLHDDLAATQIDQSNYYVTPTSDYEIIYDLTEKLAGHSNCNPQYQFNTYGYPIYVKVENMMVKIKATDENLCDGSAKRVLITIIDPTGQVKIDVFFIQGQSQALPPVQNCPVNVQINFQPTFDSITYIIGDLNNTKIFDGMTTSNLNCNYFTYTVRLSNADLPSFLTFNPTTRMLTINSASATTGDYQLTYKGQLQNQQTQSRTFNLYIRKCELSNLKLQEPQTSELNYFVNGQEQSFYPKIHYTDNDYCKPLSYTLKFTNGTQIQDLSFVDIYLQGSNAQTMRVKIQTSQTIYDGKYDLIMTTRTGNNLYHEKSYSLALNITSCNTIAIGKNNVFALYAKINQEAQVDIRFSVEANRCQLTYTLYEVNPNDNVLSYTSINGNTLKTRPTDNNLNGRKVQVRVRGIAEGFPNNYVEYDIPIYISSCDQNGQINTVPTASITYTPGQNNLFPLSKWTTSHSSSSCEEFRYYLALNDRDWLPSFIQFDQETLYITIDVQTAIAGTYNLKFFGYFISGQFNSIQFSLTVGQGCTESDLKFGMDSWVSTINYKLGGNEKTEFIPQIVYTDANKNAICGSLTQKYYINGAVQTTMPSNQYFFLEFRAGQAYPDELYIQIKTSSVQYVGTHNLTIEGISSNSGIKKSYSISIIISSCDDFVFPSLVLADRVYVIGTGKQELFQQNNLQTAECPITYQIFKPDGGIVDIQYMGFTENWYFYVNVDKQNFAGIKKFTINLQVTNMPTITTSTTMNIELVGCLADLTITKTPVNDIVYYIGASNNILTYQLQEWTTNDPNCKSFVYKLYARINSVDEEKIPVVFSYEQNTRTFKIIETNINQYYIGDYVIVVKGTLNQFKTEELLINVKVKALNCDESILTTANLKQEAYSYKNTDDGLEIQLPEFTSSLMPCTIGYWMEYQRDSGSGNVDTITMFDQNSLILNVKSTNNDVVGVFTVSLFGQIGTIDDKRQSISFKLTIYQDCSFTIDYTGATLFGYKIGDPEKQLMQATLNQYDNCPTPSFYLKIKNSNNEYEGTDIIKAQVISQQLIITTLTEEDELVSIGQQTKLYNFEIKGVVYWGENDQYYSDKQLNIDIRFTQSCQNAEVIPSQMNNQMFQINETSTIQVENFTTQPSFCSKYLTYSTLTYFDMNGNYKGQPPFFTKSGNVGPIQLIFETNLDQFAGEYKIKLLASGRAMSGYLEFQITIKDVVDSCIPATISTTTMSTQYFYVNDVATTTSFDKFTTNPADCRLVYSYSVTPPNVLDDNAIELLLPTKTMKVQITNNAHTGSYIVTITVKLKDNEATTNTISFELQVKDQCDNANIETKPIANIDYMLPDHSSNTHQIEITPWTTNKQTNAPDCSIFIYELQDTATNQAPTQGITISGSTISIQTQDIGLVDTTIIIKVLGKVSSYQIRKAYMTFQISYIKNCLSATIIYSQPEAQTYVIGDLQTKLITYWSTNPSFCYTQIYWDVQVNRPTDKTHEGFSQSISSNTPEQKYYVQTNNKTQAGSYTLKIKATINNVDTVVQVPYTLIDPCPYAILTPTSQSDKEIIIGYPIQEFPIEHFNSNISNTICGDFYYSELTYDDTEMNPNKALLQSYLTQSHLKFECNSYLLQNQTIKFKLTGSQDNIASPKTFTAFNVIVKYSCSLLQVSANFPLDIQNYRIKDNPKVIEYSDYFNKNFEGCGTMVYTCDQCTGNSVLDFDTLTGRLTIFSSSPDDIEELSLTIKAKITTPDAGDKSDQISVTIQISLSCEDTTINPVTTNNKIFTIGTSAQIYEVQPFTDSIGCQDEIKYSATLENGDQLPETIKLNSQTRKITLETATLPGSYVIKLYGTVRSNIASTQFTITMQCPTATIDSSGFIDNNQYSYKLMEDPKYFSIDHFKQSPSQCGSALTIVVQFQLDNQYLGSSEVGLIDYIIYEPDYKRLKVYLQTQAFKKIWYLNVIATNTDGETSTVSVSINVVECTIQQLNYPIKLQNYEYFVNSGQVELTIPEFSQTPNCGFTLNYDIESLPQLPISSVNFNSNSRIITINSNNLMDVNQYNVIIKAQFEDKEASYPWQLKISQKTDIPPIFKQNINNIIMNVNQIQTLILPQIKSFTENKVDIKVNLVSVISFVKYNTNTHTFLISPTIQDQGQTYTISITLSDSIQTTLQMHYSFAIQVKDQNDIPDTNDNSNQNQNNGNSNNGNNNNQNQQQQNTNQMIDNFYQNFNVDQTSQDFLDEEANAIQNEVFTNADFDMSSITSAQLQKLLKKINKKVYEPNLTPKISSISQNGLVIIDLNMDMIIPKSYINFNDNVMRVKTTTDSSTSQSSSSKRFRLLETSSQDKFVPFDKLKNIQDKQFTWQMTTYKSRQIQLQVDFEEPEEISQDIPDYLSIQIIMNGFFIAEDSKLPIQYNYYMKRKIPRQMRKDSLSQLVGAMGGTASSSVQNILMGNMAIQIFLSTTLQYLWGMINALQIIFHLPLMNLNFPSNVQFVFSLFIGLTSFDVLPTEFLEEQIFKFDSEEAFNDNFETMDIFIKHCF